MKILTPLDSPEDVKDLVSAGANEFFVGVVTDEWTKTYSQAGSINRRESKRSNLPDYASLALATTIAHDLGAKVFLTLNAHYYIDEQYRLLDEALDNARNAHVDAVVVADIGLMQHMMDKGCDISIHVSSEALVINREALDFFRQFNIKRIVFPREISLPEIADITRGNKDLEFESFVLRERCPFAGALCQPTHGLNRNYFCAFGWRHRYFSYEGAVFARELEDAIRRNDMYYSMWAGNSGTVVTMPGCLEQTTNAELIHQRCGICSIPLLKATGIDSLKIPGRGVPLDRKVEYVRFVRRAVDHLNSEPASYDRFCRSMKNNPSACDMTYNCYYR